VRLPSKKKKKFGSGWLSVGHGLEGIFFLQLQQGNRKEIMVFFLFYFIVAMDRLLNFFIT